MQRSLFALLLVAACSDTSVTVIDNPPHATILLPSAEDSFVQGTDWLHLQGTVGDGEQPAAAAQEQ